MAKGFDIVENISLCDWLAFPGLVGNPRDDLRLGVVGKYRGYVEYRPVPMHPEIAFVEFETIDRATAVLSALNGFTIDENTQMFIQHAK
jgi:hypothetical protein